MLIIYGMCTFILGSSAIMVGYVWIRDVKHTRAQAANVEQQNDENQEDTKPSEDILADYPNLVKKTA